MWRAHVAFTQLLSTVASCKSYGALSQTGIWHTEYIVKIQNIILITRNPSSCSLSFIPTPTFLLPYFFFQECHVNGIAHYITFRGWLKKKSLFKKMSIILQGINQFVVCIDCFSLWLNSIPWYRYTVVCLIIYLLKDIWLITSFLLL